MQKITLTNFISECPNFNIKTADGLTLARWSSWSCQNTTVS